MIDIFKNFMPKSEVVSALLFLCMVLLTAVVMRAYDINRIRVIDNQSESEKLMALSQLSVELIKNSWFDKPNTIDKVVNSLQNHRDVSQTYLTNHLAGILSPKSRALEIVNDPNIEQLLSNNDIDYLSVLGDSQLSVYRRIELNGEVKGVLVVSKILIIEDIEFFSLGFLLRVILLGAIGLACSIMLVKVWKRPWRNLHQMYEQALETGKSPEPVDTKDEIVELHRVLYSRYLIKTKNRP